MEAHLITKHTKNVYKCNACPIACFSVDALNEHKMNVHKNITPITHSYQQCQLCPERLIPKSRIYVHVNEHSQDPLIQVYVYQCNACKFSAQRKTDFAAHKSICAKNDKIVLPTISEKNTQKIVPMNNNNHLQSKILVPADPSVGSNINNYVKVVYDISQNNKDIQLKLLPKSYLKNVKTVNWSKPEERGKPSIFTVEQMSRKDDAVSTHGEYSEKLLSKKTEIEKGADSKLIKILPNHEQSVSNKEITLLRICALCKVEIVAIPKKLHISNFQALCYKCSKSHTFLKTNNKLMIVSRNKIVSSANGRISMISSQNEDRDVIFEGQIKKTATIALNGPSKSKLSNESPENTGKSNRYRCHICKELISIEWKKVQEHFTEKHPNFNFLLLSPKIDKLNLTGLKIPFIVKDNKLHPKDNSKTTAQSYDDNNTNKTDSNDESDNMEEDSSVTETKKEWDNNSDDGESMENEGFNEHFYYMKRERDIPIDYDLIPSKLKKKKRSHKPAEIPSTPFSSGQILPPLEQTSDDTKYKCAKCEYSDNDVESFHKHIVTHRTDDNAIQCMECGLCFVVKPSFEKHLFISHRIKDVDSYMQKNNCYNVEDNFVEEITLSDNDSKIVEETPSGLVENQCRVCREIFNTAFELNKHIRIHGMAFLLMKKKESKTP